MGCGNTKTVPLTPRRNDSNLGLTIETVQSTWTNIKRIENLGPKIMAHLLHVYPILKRTSNISPSLNRESDLIRINEVRDLGNMLLSLYADLIKCAHLNLDQRIESKAFILNKQKIQPRLIKHFGQSFYHLITHQINIKLNQSEKDSWLEFIDYVSNKLVQQIHLFNSNQH